MRPPFLLLHYINKTWPDCWHVFTFRHTRTDTAPCFTTNATLSERAFWILHGRNKYKMQQAFSQTGRQADTQANQHAGTETNDQFKACKAIAVHIILRRIRFLGARPAGNLLHVRCETCGQRTTHSTKSLIRSSGSSQNSACGLTCWLCNTIAFLMYLQRPLKIRELIWLTSVGAFNKCKLQKPNRFMTWMYKFFRRVSVTGRLVRCACADLRMCRYMNIKLCSYM